MQHTIYRIVDESTGLCWNNNVPRPSFVCVDEGHVWNSYKAAENRLSNYYSYAGRNILTIVETKVQETEISRVTRSPSTGEILVGRVRKKWPNLSKYVIALTKRKTFEKFRYLLVFSGWSRGDYRKTVVDIHEMMDIIPAKSKLTISSYVYAVDNDCAVFAIKSVLSTLNNEGLKMKVVDLKEDNA